MLQVKNILSMERQYVQESLKNNLRKLLYLFYLFESTNF